MKSSPLLSVAVDIDAVLADTPTLISEWLGDERRPLPVSEMYTYRLADNRQVPREMSLRAITWFNSGGASRAVALPQSVDAIWHLASMADVTYITSRPTSLGDITRRWLTERGFPNLPVKFAPGAEKYELARIFDLVVDDDHAVMDARSECCGIGVMMDYPWNKAPIEVPRAHFVHRARDWSAVLEHLTRFISLLDGYDVAGARMAALSLPYRRARMLYGDRPGLAISASDVVLGVLIEGIFGESASWRVGFDMCCGCGFSASVLGSFSQELIAIDVNAARVRHCQVNLGLLDLEGTVVCEDAFAMLESCLMPNSLVHADPHWGRPEEDAHLLTETAPDSLAIISACKAKNAQLLLRLPRAIDLESLDDDAAAYRCRDVQTGEEFVYVISPIPRIAPGSLSGRGIALVRIR